MKIVFPSQLQLLPFWHNLVANERCVAFAKWLHFQEKKKKEEIHKMSRKVYCINECREWKLFAGMWKDFIVEISHSEKDLYMYLLCRKYTQIWEH